jgi:hypothetical protein
MVTQSGSIRSSLPFTHILVIQKDFTMAKTYDLPLIPLEYIFSNPHGDSIEKTTEGIEILISELSNLSPIIHHLRSKPDPHLRNDVGSLPLGGHGFHTKKCKGIAYLEQICARWC